jgi:hypothetical protein
MDIYEGKITIQADSLNAYAVPSDHNKKLPTVEIKN